MLKSQTLKTSMTSLDNNTPQISLSEELKKVLNERNLLTAKTREKVCSMLGSPLKENNEQNKRQDLRMKAIKEILSTEKAYMKQLQVLMNFFIIPLKERAIINTSSHTILFGQIEMIYNINQELLKRLKNDPDNVAFAFLKVAPYLKLYSVYAFDYKKALLTLQELTSKNPVFRKFLEDTESRPEVQKKLNSLMIIPIQRIPRYRLLLQQVLLYTSRTDADFKSLQDAVKQIENTVSHINTVIEDQESTQLLLNLQNSLINRTPNIVKPSRKIIKEGVLYKLTRNGTQIKRYCVLMSDIFIYCRILKDRTRSTVVESSLECCCVFPLKKCKIYDMFPGNFKITCQGDGVILCTTDQHIGQSWLSALRDTIDIHIECRKTLRKESSKRKPIRKKELKNFEAEYVLSPSSKKSDFETLLRCKADSDSESDSLQKSCFNLLPSKGHKRKHSDNEGSFATFTSNKISSVFSQTPLSQIKNNSKQNILVSKINKLVSSSGNNEHNQNNENICNTYDFINRYPETKPYFEIPDVCFTKSSKNTNEVRKYNNTLQDCLYPLRMSSNNSSKESLNSVKEYIKKENPFTDKNDNDAIPSIPKRKRVQFEDEKKTVQEDFKNYNRPYSLNANVIQQNQTSFRQRILDFFSKIF